MNNFTKKRYIVCFFLFAFFLTGILCYTEVFAADTTVNQNTYEIDPNQMVDITIDLEDTTRYMGISVYQVCTYDGEKYAYTDDFREFSKEDYYLKINNNQKYEDINLFLESMEDGKRRVPMVSAVVQNGVGKVEGLPVGVYLILQNDAASNAELVSYSLVEAPILEKNLGYLYDIRLYPRWEKITWFSFRPEVVYPLEVGIILILCVLFSFWGARIGRSLMFVFCFFVSGLLGFSIGITYINDYLWLLVIFTISAFLGVGAVWMIITVLQGSIVKRNLTNNINKQLFWITPVWALIISIITIRSYISKHIIISILVPMVVAFIGGIYQHAKQKDVIIFHTYEDLLAMKRKDEGENENA